MANQARVKLSVIIIGGGVGGLALAIFLKQDGHNVTLLERSDGSYGTRSPGGISLFNNSTLILKRRRLFEKGVAEIADTGSARSIFRYTGDFIAKNKKSLPHSFVHRGDLLTSFSKIAVDLGVDVRLTTTVTTLSELADNVSVTLGNGTILEADLVVGADGINSFVRAQVFPEIKPQLTPCVVLLLYIPAEDMKADTGTAELLNDEPYHITFGPERTIVAWTMTKRQVYHLQLSDYAYANGEAYGINDHLNSPYIATIADTSGLRNRWSDFGPQTEHILKSTSNYTKWKIAELPEMKTYTSPTGRMWLLGDACHAVKPFAGQGANMAFEDAESIATLFANISSKKDLPSAAQVYSRVRIPRLAGLRAVVELNVKQFGSMDKEEQLRKDPNLRFTRTEVYVSEELDRLKESEAQVNLINGMSNEDRFAWLEEYDAATETLKAWSHAH